MSQQQHVHRKKSIATSLVAPPAPAMAHEAAASDRSAVSGQATSEAAPEAQSAGPTELGHDFRRIAITAPGSVLMPPHASGASLPDEQRTRYERSLHADLSGVRVHTDAQAASAADRLNARAFTIDQQIHFGRGEYAPGSGAGEALLAHEVAHAAQRASRAPVSAAGHVSRPGDAQELEADVAASAMATGAPARVSPASGIARKAKPDNLEAAADASEQDDDKVQAISVTPTMQVSNITDRANATTAVHVLDQIRPILMQGVKQGEATQEQVATNDKARSEISVYLDAADQQSGSASIFQGQYRRLALDYNRLDGMFGAYSGASLNDMKGNDEAKKAADITQQPGGSKATAQHMAELASKLGEHDEEIATLLQQLPREQADLEELGADVDAAQHTATTSLGRLQGAQHTLASALATLESSGAQHNFDEQKKAAEQSKKLVEGLFKTLKEGVVTGAKEGPMEGLKSAGKSFLTDVLWDALLKDQVMKLNEQLNISAGAFPTKWDDVAAAEQHKAIEEALNGARAQVHASNQEFPDKLHDYARKASSLERKKHEFREDMEKLGRKLAAGAKKQGAGSAAGADFKTITTFLAEADTFLVQAKLVQNIGKKELDSRQDGSAAKTAQTTPGGYAGLTYYDAHIWKAKNWLGKEVEHVGVSPATEIKVHTGINPTSTLGAEPNEAQTYGSAQGYGGSTTSMNPVFEKTLDDVQKWTDKVTVFREQLSTYLFLPPS